MQVPSAYLQLFHRGRTNERGEENPLDAICPHKTSPPILASVSYGRERMISWFSLGFLRGRRASPDI